MKCEVAPSRADFILLHATFTLLFELVIISLILATLEHQVSSFLVSVEKGIYFMGVFFVIQK